MADPFMSIGCLRAALATETERFGAHSFLPPNVGCSLCMRQHIPFCVDVVWKTAAALIIMKHFREIATHGLKGATRSWPRKIFRANDDEI